MDAISKVIIIGAGAMGVPPAVKLSALSDVDVRILADEKRVERYRRDGIFLNGRRLDFSYITPYEERDFIPQLVIIATKNGDLDDALELLRGRLEANTIILPLLNGISARDVIIRKYPDVCAFYGLYLGHASVREGNNVNSDGEGRIVFGNSVNEKLTAEVAAVKELFERAQIASEIPRDMLSAMWKKFVLNVGVNQTQALYRADYGMVQESAEMRDFCMELMSEAVSVAEKLNIPETEYLKGFTFEMVPGR
ncbi:MAG: ketopantoate reductase family protein [Akkermansia sp.]|nr:ketopantoate reductase family protein [Akkermansia sp.]